ncbi:hypothetical protein ACFFX0_26795 [Citricoccus parietis]|uniref:Uncharacterized protein n=1 Tax=Citricoccus parietis TaxID=592307 RepID=A0ABV5G6Q3_9MICC
MTHRGDQQLILPQCPAPCRLGGQAGVSRQLARAARTEEPV